MGHRTGRGFTLIELLVVVSVIGLLCALVIPAVQGSREAARRSQCASQLKNLGVAPHNHAESQGVFPAGYGKSEESYLVRLLPFLDQAALYNAINFQADRYAGVVCNENGTFLFWKVGIFICPSDLARSDRLAESSTNYAANSGADKFRGDCLRGDGVFIVGGLRAAEISDGLSQTAGLSEWVVGNGDETHPTRLGSGYLVDESVTTFDRFSAACRALDPQLTKANGPGYRGFFWISAGSNATQYDHVLTPNTPPCSMFNHLFDSHPAASYHPGGIHSLLMDGGVRFLKTTINPAVWSGLGTRAGGEVASSDAL